MLIFLLSLLLIIECPFVKFINFYYFLLQELEMKPILQAENQNYRFQYQQGNPNSLTMTKTPKQIGLLMYELPTYIWIDANSFNNKDEKQSIESSINCSLQCFRSVKQAKEFVSHLLYVVIICSLSLAQEVEDAFKQTASVSTIICFCSKLAYYEKSKEEGKLGKKFKFGTNKKGQLVEYLKNNRHQDYIRRQLPNLLSIKSDKASSNMLMKTIYTMINQITNRSELIKEMVSLAKFGGFKRPKDLQEIVEFEADILNQKVSQEKIINWYTRNSFVYIITNNLLRIGRHPAQLFPLQPYFKQLFQSIRKLYKEQKNDEKTMKCYRGALMSEQQLKEIKANVGGIYQSLGFLSTSKRFEAAEMFCKNTIFVIDIKDYKRDEQSDFGFVDVSKMSKFPGEEQILFNALNCFKITEVRPPTMIKQQMVTIVQMEYSTMANGNNPICKLTAEEENAKVFLEHQKRMKQNSMFGEIILDYGESLQGCEYYWLSYKKIANSDKDIIKALQSQAKIHNNKGDFKSALKAYSQVIQRKEKANETIDSTYSTTLSNIGSVYDSMGEYKKALEYYTKCQQIKKKTIGENHPSFATTLSNIGSVYKSMGEYKKALEYYTKCQQIDKKTIGENHPSFATTLSNIGNVYDSMGEYKKALEYYTKCQQIEKKTIGENHPSFATTLSNIGNVYKSMGEYKKALEYYTKCQQIEKKTIGENHPSFATTLSNIGNVYDSMGEYKKALEYYTKCQQIDKKTIGENHPSFATTLSNIGNVYDSMGEYKKALEYYTKCQQIKKKTIGENHPSFATTLSNIGSVYKSMGEYKKALEYYTKCQQIKKKTIGENHPSFATTLSNIGNVYKSMGEYKKALEYYTKCQQIEKKTIGENHPSFATTLSNIGSVYKSMGEYKKALEYYTKCQQIEKKTIGENHPSFATTLSNIGNVYKSMGEYKKALEYYTKCQQIEKKTIGENHPSFATTLSNIGLVYKSMGEYKKALEYYTKCQQIKKKTIGENHPSFATTLSNIGSLYETTNQLSKALSAYKKCLKIRREKLGVDHNLTLRIQGYIRDIEEKIRKNK